MRRMFFRKRHSAVGAAPGTLVVATGSDAPRVHVMSYSETDWDEREELHPGQLVPPRDDGRITWIDVQGLGDESMLRDLGASFAIHPLALEDAVNVPQRPKGEDYEEQHLFITRMARLRRNPDEDDALDVEQISIFVGHNYVLTLQERHGDVLDPVRERIRVGKGLIRASQADYLAYAIIDTVVDGYYPVLDALGDALEALEDQVLARPDRKTLREIHHVKRQLLMLRRSVWPQREAVQSLLRGESPFISKPVRLYLRDTYDHVVQVLDISDSYWSLAGSLLETYMSLASNRQNEVMKVLTIMSSIFIPLTFMAGIYGMNFDNMPELHARWSYPMLLAAMVVVAAFMVVFFARKGWLWGDDDDE